MHHVHRLAALASALTLIAPAVADAAIITEDAFSFATRKGPVGTIPPGTTPAYYLDPTTLQASTVSQYGGVPFSGAVKFSLDGLAGQTITSAYLGLTAGFTQTNSIGNPTQPLGVVVQALSAAGTPVGLADFLLPSATIATVNVAPNSITAQPISVDVTSFVNALIAAGFDDVEFRVDLATTNSGSVLFDLPSNVAAPGRPVLLVNAIPEPASAALLAAGLVVAGLRRARRAA